MGDRMYGISISLPDIPEIKAKELEDRIVATASALAFDKLVTLAQARLGSTKDSYIHGVQPPKRVNRAMVITLQGALPNMIENGWPGGDLRKTLIDKNKKKKQGKPRKMKDGSVKPGFFYAHIPFTHKSKSMPKNIIKAAKELKATLTAPGAGSTLWGDRLEKGLAPKAKKHHATDPFAGMVRLEKTYRAATQSTYRTFRTISWANKRGWIHPGITAVHFFPETEAYLASMGDDILKAALAQM